MIYLDLNHWISLAQAATGHRDGIRFLPVLEACRQIRRHRRGIFPLSNSHYVEISKIKDPRQRQDLATVMEELSGFSALISPTVLKKIELDAVLDTRFPPSPTAWTDYPVLGYGVGFTVGRPMRPRLVDADGSDATEKYRRVPAWSDLLDEMALLLERSVLAGPTDVEVPDMKARGWDPEAAWRVAEERALEEREQTARIDASTDKNWRKGRLRDIVSAHEMLIELKETLRRACEERGGTNVLEPWVNDRTEIRGLVRSMPSCEVMIELKTAMHRNAERARKWSPNDVVDMDAMSLAVPYCDVVVTEQHAHHVLTAAHLDERMNTTVLRDLTDLPRYLPSSPPTV